MKKNLTIRDMSRLGAESDEITQFSELFPKNMPITGHNLQILENAGFSLGWILARGIPKGLGWDLYCNNIASLMGQRCSGTLTPGEYIHDSMEESARALRENWKPHVPKDVWADYGDKDKK